MPLGTRLRLGDHTGTVRYAGPVDGTAGEWLGVEWDDPARGKHDGVKDGKRYFSCTRIPNSASFIRPTARDLSYGSSFLDALKAKYVESFQGPQETVVLGSSKGAIQVEAVDLDKIRAKFADLGSLREVSLDTDYVSRYDGPPGSIQATCPNVRGLDLSMSLIPDWNTISAICSELPWLQRLALNRTRLHPPEHLTPEPFANLVELRLNATLTTWREMQQITSAMAQLKTVEVGHNRIAQLSTVTSSVEGSALKTVNLDSNALNDWPSIVSALLPYPRLYRVVLAANLLERIPPPPQSQQILRIQHLSLSHNQLSSWDDIDAVAAWCPNIQTLSMTGNPLFGDPVRGRSARPLVIARIPSLVALDAAAISLKERTDCELFYLSQIVLHEPDDHTRSAAHPRWAALCAKHGRPDEPGRRDLHHDTLSRRLLELNVYHIPQAPAPPTAAAERHPATTHFVLRALPTMTLRALRLKLRKTIRNSKVAESAETPMRIWLKMGDNEDAYALLAEERDAQDLAWLGVESGSSILCAV
ncbi:CAP-Gly domain-containing protein [Mycena kentingensis (nom. inval.)]|nr:CAP-Gly domain-containing protein [Mycena kentingensis (nom. inval.)]